MGKIKQGKRLSSHRNSIDPLGGKMPLADEIESLRLAKSKSTEQVNSSTRKRQADEDEYVNEKMTAKILMQARKQQSELQDEYGIDLDEYNNNEKNQTSSVKLEDDSLAGSSSIDTRPFKRFQSNFKQQQKIRKSDHDDSDSDSDVEDNLENCENKRGYYSDEEIVCVSFH
jgi:hypothetical protein